MLRPKDSDAQRARIGKLRARRWARPLRAPSSWFSVLLLLARRPLQSPRLSSMALKLLARGGPSLLQVWLCMAAAARAMPAYSARPTPTRPTAACRCGPSCDGGMCLRALICVLSLTWVWSLLLSFIHVYHCISIWLTMRKKLPSRSYPRWQGGHRYRRHFVVVALVVSVYNYLLVCIRGKGWSRCRQQQPVADDGIKLVGAN